MPTPPVARDFLYKHLDSVFDDIIVCIEWPFAVNKYGYPIIGPYGKRTWGTDKVTRIVLLKFCGEPPSSKHYAAHKPIVCHNRKCINPNHLSWKSSKENAEDRKLDRTEADRSGTKNGRALLTESDVLAIYNSNATHVELAKRFNVSETAISDIRKGRSWAWLTKHTKDNQCV